MGMWKLLTSNDLYVGDLVRRERSYEGEAFETADRDAWSRGMPEVIERWYVEDITRNGWITLVQERRENWGNDIQGNSRWSDLFKETGRKEKFRINRSLRLLVALAPGEYEDRWERFGLEGVSARPPEKRMPVGW